MNAEIKTLIKLLEAMQQKGIKYISHDDLLTVATPKINDIDDVIKLLDGAIKKRSERKLSGDVNINEAAKLALISRKTFYRWEALGLFTRKEENRYTRKRTYYHEMRFSITELKETILSIKTK
jgi:hypothetical protein